MGSQTLERCSLLILNTHTFCVCDLTGPDLGSPGSEQWENWLSRFHKLQAPGRGRAEMLLRDELSPSDWSGWSQEAAGEGGETRDCGGAEHPLLPSLTEFINSK